MAIQNLKS